jgi:hypothetical protein
LIYHLYLSNLHHHARITPSSTSIMGFRLLQSIGRSFQNVRLFISTKLFKKTKEGPAPGQKHDSMFSAPFFQFLQASNDDSTTTTTTTTTSNPAIYTIRAGKIIITSTHAPMASPHLQHLPLSILTRILRPLLTSPIPLILHPDAHTPSTYRTHLHPSILLTARLFHHLGTPLLYGANTLTTSTPYTSRSFDTHLLALRGPYRQLIKSIKLEIAWADELWAKFPLIARVVGEIVGLKRLEIVITKKGGGREGVRGEMMRRVEERCFEELVKGDLKALEELRLVGFGEGGFAGGLERWVKGGRR